MTFILEAVKNGKDVILFDNYKYRESYPLKSGYIVWRCLGKTCNASIKTNSEKTTIYSTNNKHTGQHPVTMRVLTPTQRKHSGSLSTSSANLPSPSTPAPQSSPSEDTTAHAQHQSDEQDTPSDLLAENNSLREQLARAREERQIVLNHSIESDQRLLQ